LLLKIQVSIHFTFAFGCNLYGYNMEEADALADRVAVMALGRLRAVGTPLVGLSLTPGCRIGFVAYTGCHRLIVF
jgi:ABC-type proline/glycine betaine transport system ATPase subunit